MVSRFILLFFKGGEILPFEEIQYIYNHLQKAKLLAAVYLAHCNPTQLSSVCLVFPWYAIFRLFCYRRIRLFYIQFHLSHAYLVFLSPSSHSPFAYTTTACLCWHGGSKSQTRNRRSNPCALQRKLRSIVQFQRRMCVVDIPSSHIQHAGPFLCVSIFLRLRNAQLFGSNVNVRTETLASTETSLPADPIRIQNPWNVSTAMVEKEFMERRGARGRGE